MSRLLLGATAALLAVFISNGFLFAEKEDEFTEVKTGSSQQLQAEKKEIGAHAHKHEGFLKEIMENRVWLLFILAAAGTAFFYAKRYRFRFLFMMVSLAVLGFVQGGCPDSVGASVRIFYDIKVNKHWLLSGTLLLIPLLVTLISGRTFCSSACPLGALQEFAAARDKLFRISYKRERQLRWLRLAVFLLLVVLSLAKSGYVFEAIDPFKAIFNLMGNTVQWVLVAVLLVLSLVVYRPFCRYFCPLALYLKLAAKFSRHKIRNNKNTCSNCGICRQACPVSVISENNIVDNSECIRCGICLDACPKKSLVFTSKKGEGLE